MEFVDRVEGAGGFQGGRAAEAGGQFGGKAGDPGVAAQEGPGFAQRLALRAFQGRLQVGGLLEGEVVDPREGGVGAVQGGGEEIDQVRAPGGVGDALAAP
ncbi:hypothetical protein ACFZDF_03495 [Streptomyces sp. NPDC007910]|uniref:hypothetical protein n=1 Tax=Streptomyces sp. NPDC007910 TaxID=3364790 RepID=UPI0036E72DBD